MTYEQQTLVENHLDIVKNVIRVYVHNIRSIGIYTYDDLYQLGCEALCHAAMTWQPGRDFAVYAKVVIRNKLYSELRYASRRKQCECLVLDSSKDDIPSQTADDASINNIYVFELRTLLCDSMKQMPTAARKGVHVLQLIAQGYSYKEIGEEYDVGAKLVRSWYYMARNRLRSDSLLSSYATASSQ